MAASHPAAAAFAHAAALPDEQALSPPLAPHPLPARAGDPAAGHFGCVRLRRGFGTPKWLYLSYPVARWLKTVSGLEGKRVASFTTFCGPPLKVFEIEMLFEPLEARLRLLGAIAKGRLAISSDYHEYFFFGEMRSLFRWLSLKAFGRPLVDFTLDGEVGRAEVERFCDEVGGGCSGNLLDNGMGL
jgi:hypothetical protein